MSPALFSVSYAGFWGPANARSEVNSMQTPLLIAVLAMVYGISAGTAAGAA